MSENLHSSFGFSGQSVILACPGSVGMTEGLDSETNDAAELGTAVHELAETAYKLRMSCNDFIGLEFNGYKVTEKMAEAGNVYVNHIRSILNKIPHATVMLEKKVILSSINADLLWGTSDCLIIDFINRTLYVGDYKNGYGLVEVDKINYCHSMNAKLIGNAQCAGYALAAMDTYDLWDKVDTVQSFIVQPNNTNHKDGIIRYYTYHKEDLNLWWQAYKLGCEEAVTSEARLNAGTHCRYCPASGFCGPRIRRNMELIGLTEGLKYVSPEQLIPIYKEIPMIKKSLERIEERLSRHARQGKPVEGYKLVKPILRGSCKDEDKFIAEMQSYGLPLDPCYNKKLAGKTHIKTELPKIISPNILIGVLNSQGYFESNVELQKAINEPTKFTNKFIKELVDKHFIVPEGSPVLAPMEDKRVAISPDKKPSAVGVFSRIY